MAMEVDGAAILAAIAKSPTDFSMDIGQINALALATLLARLKDKALKLPHVRSLARAVGSHDFGLALDHMPAKDVTALIKRLDSKHPDLRTADAEWHKGQIIRLAEGASEPASPATRPTRAPRPAAPPKAKVPKTGEVMKSKALKPRSKKTPAKSEA